MPMLKKEKLLSGCTPVLVVLLSLGPGTLKAKAQDASQIEANVHNALANKRFQGVTVSVQGRDVVLGGHVSLYQDKEDADKKAHQVKGVKGVDNEIQVDTPQVEDTTLRDKLARELSYEYVGYGTTTFNALTIAVHDGVVTLGGTVYWPPDKDAAVSLVANTPGVRDVVDNIKVAPVSPMDDRLRLELYRAIYGAPQLQRYALDPAKPIRITVVNGNVTLSGVVDSKMDREVAGIRANTVPGVFKVTNDLQVASQSGK